MRMTVTSDPTWNETVRNYILTRNLRERSEVEESKLKRDLLGYLAERGEESEEGHRTLFFPTKRLGKKLVNGIRRQRRVSQSLEQDKAIAWLTANNLLEQCTYTEVFLNEDAILSLAMSGEIPDEVLRSFYSQKESYALVMMETEDEDDIDDDDE